jgi:hypothetical protein
VNTVALAVKVTADTAAAQQGLDGVTQSTSKVGQAGKVAGRLLAAGLAIGAVAAVKAANAAAEDEAAQVKLAGALKNATGARAKDIASVEAWITAQGTALGVADTELRPAMEALVTATKDVGKAQELAAIAMDISARKGLSLESVSKSLAKAQATGNVAALAKYGVATKDAEGNTKSLEAVQKDLAKTYKGAAADAAGTAAGQQKKLQVAMGELQEEIGAKLLPVMLKLSEAGLKVVDWITQNQAAAAAIIGTFGGLLAVVKLVSVATTIWSTVTKVAAAAQALLNIALAANPVVLIVLAVVALAAALVLAYKKSETFRNIVNGVFGAISKTVSTVVDFIKNNWQKMLVILTGPIGLAVALIVKHWDSIKAGAKTVVDWVKDNWSNLKEKLSGPIEAAKTLITGYLDGIKTAFSAIVDVIQSIIDKIQALIDKIKSIPKPDLNPLNGRFGSGSGGSSSVSGSGLVRTPQGTLVMNVNVNGYVGDEVRLAREFERIINNNRSRLSR